MQVSTPNILAHEWTKIIMEWWMINFTEEVDTFLTHIIAESFYVNIWNFS
jgi:hypothetical protein